MKPVQDLAVILAKLKDGTATEGDWRTLALAAAEGRELRWVEELATFRHQTKGDGAKFMYDLAVHLIRSGKAATVSWLADTMPAESAFHGIFLWASGLDRDLQLPETSDRLRRGARHAFAAANSVFSGDAQFSPVLLDMLIQANLIEPAKIEGESPETILTAALPRFETWGAPFLLFSACDEVYFEHYVESLAQDFFTQYPFANLLILIANPTSDGNLTRDRLAKRFPNIAYAYCQGPSTAQFYACSRFLAAAEVLAAYSMPVIIVDVDSVFRSGFADIVNESLCHSIAFAILDDGFLPSLQASATLMAFQPDQVAQTFLHLVSSFICAKFREEYTPWMVDQAALYCAWKLMPAQSGIADLNALLPLSLRLPAATAANHVIDANTRIASRGLGQLQVRFDENACPLFSV